MLRKLILVGALAAATTIGATEGGDIDACGREGYGRAVCLYDGGSYSEAAGIFQLIATSGEAAPETVRSWYFLARIRMMEGRWEEASRDLVLIYRLSRSFYREWGCDFLLGQCREALGKS